MSTKGYKPIENYGIIGDLHTTCLIDKDSASIDYLCYPFFDSPTLFSNLLDSTKGGYFNIKPSLCQPTEDCGGGIRSRQMYLTSSNVLLTRFTNDKGISQVTDFMPVPKKGFPMPSTSTSTAECSLLFDKPFLSSSVLRKVECIRGKSSMDIEIIPSFNYASIRHTLHIIYKNSSSLPSLVFKSDTLSIEIQLFIYLDIGSDISVEEESKMNAFVKNFKWDLFGDEDAPGARVTINLEEEQHLFITMTRYSSHQINKEGLLDLSYEKCEVLLQNTLSYWYRWIRKCTYRGRWREMVHRSALVLKLLTFAPTGAIIAAPTFSLPEDIGGPLNWDYRFVWIRDAAFTVYAFIRIGFKDEALAFMNWIEKRCQDWTDSKPLQILYDIHGNPPSHMINSFLEDLNKCTRRKNVSSDKASILLPSLNASELPSKHEIELAHLAGYRNSKPVRIGNAATEQEQFDILGELMDSIYLSDKYCQPISIDFWNIIRYRIVPTVLKTWNLPDHGIWEFRHGQEHYVYSKVMNWVALDRAIRLANKRSFPADINLWRETRDTIYNDILEKGWNKEKGSFTQYYGSSDLDASNLIMPLVFFMAPSDPYFLQTLKATLAPPKAGGLTVHNLVFRRPPPAFQGQNLISSPTKRKRLSSTPQPLPDSAYNDTPTAFHNQEGTFHLCSFWLIESLTRAGKTVPHYLAKAVQLFEELLSYSNQLGLYSEELSETGEALGNFPQALTHLSLISSAFNLDRVLDSPSASISL